MMSKAPNELLESWVEQIPRGYALDLGAGDGRATIWLAECGFKVEAVERNTEACKRLRKACMGLSVDIQPVDLLEFAFPYRKYRLIHASAILHFIKPTDLWTVADRIIDSLTPGGFLIAEVLTTDDPGYEAIRDSGQAQIEPNTFQLSSPDEVIHYFESQELRRTFSSLEPLFYEETRRRDYSDPIGFRAGASLVAYKEIPQGRVE
jgi:trans-aconitate methyltransferase